MGCAACKPATSSGGVHKPTSTQRMPEDPVTIPKQKRQELKITTASKTEQQPLVIEKQTITETKQEPQKVVEEVSKKELNEEVKVKIEEQNIVQQDEDLQEIHPETQKLEKDDELIENNIVAEINDDAEQLIIAQEDKLIEEDPDIQQRVKSPSSMQSLTSSIINMNEEIVVKALQMAEQQSFITTGRSIIQQ